MPAKIPACHSELGGRHWRHRGAPHQQAGGHGAQAVFQRGSPPIASSHGASASALRVRKNYPWQHDSPSRADALSVRWSALDWEIELKVSGSLGMVALLQ
jgi:hypothetical protein